MGLPIPQVVKDHPFITVGGIVGVIVVVALLGSGGGGSTDAADPSVTSGGADALSQLTAQLNAAAGQTAAQKEVALNNNATQVTLATIGSDAAKYAYDKSSALEEIKVASAERTTIQTSTLAAAIQQNTINAQRDIETRRIASQDAQTAGILANNVQLAQIAAQPKGLFSWLFG